MPILDSQVVNLRTREVRQLTPRLTGKAVVLG